MAVAGSAVLCSMVVGGILGLIAGFRGGWVGHLIMRLADIVMSFPSLLLALIVLYVLQASVTNVVVVLAITRIPLYLRTSRAEVLEIRERMFVTAARVMGARPRRRIWCHIAPLAMPTLITLATLDFARDACGIEPSFQGSASPPGFLGPDGARVELLSRPGGFDLAVRRDHAHTCRQVSCRLGAHRHDPVQRRRWKRGRIMTDSPERPSSKSRTSASRSCAIWKRPVPWQRSCRRSRGIIAITAKAVREKASPWRLWA
jgi:hypothetical protein